MVDLGIVSFAYEIRPCNETLVKLWEAVPNHGPPGHETYWDWRCWREDLPETTHNTPFANNTNDDDEPAGVDQDLTETTTLPESESGLGSGSGEETTNVPDAEESPGDIGLSLIPPRLCGLAILLVTLVVVLA